MAGSWEAAMSDNICRPECWQEVVRPSGSEIGNRISKWNLKSVRKWKCMRGKLRHGKWDPLGRRGRVAVWAYSACALCSRCLGTLPGEVPDLNIRDSHHVLWAALLTMKCATRCYIWINLWVESQTVLEPRSKPVSLTCGTTLLLTMIEWRTRLTFWKEFDRWDAEGVYHLG